MHSSPNESPKEITKVVIPAAGWGTRFLPATKAMPKEMLPIIDKPVIQYVVEEAVASGIKDVILITGGQKRAIEDHFDRSGELEKFLESQGKTQALAGIKEIAGLANFIYLRQKNRPIRQRAGGDGRPSRYRQRTIRGDVGRRIHFGQSSPPAADH